MDIFHVFRLLGGLAMFLFGMDTMSKSLQKQAGGKLQKILGASEVAFAGIDDGEVVVGICDFGIFANQLFKNSFCLVIFLRFHEDNASKEAKVDVLRIDSQFFVCEIHGIGILTLINQLRD